MSTPLDATADPMMLAYGAYEVDGTITFERRAAYAPTRRRRYVYYTDSRQLWRVYIKTKQKLRRVSWSGTVVVYTQVYQLVPLWPTHLQMDKGL